MINFWKAIHSLRMLHLDTSYQASCEANERENQVGGKPKTKRANPT
jgi:hypothetical protein